MMFLAVQVLTLLTLGLSALAAPCQPKISLRPSQDEFYAVPDNLEHLPPGAILRHRMPPSKISAFGFVDLNINASHQILYRTTDSHDHATATVLTVLVPTFANYSQLLSYQVAENAPAWDCAPSYALQHTSGYGGFLGTIISNAELLLIQTALSQGWVVIVPDHQGPKAAFVANKLAGQAVLDGIRAAIQSSNFTGIDPKAAITMWGYSGGAMASGWAAELHDTYAPELEIVGAAIGGVAADIASVVDRTNGGSYAGLLASGMIGLANEYPVIENILYPRLKPKHRQLFQQTKKWCLLANNNRFLRKKVLSMFNGPDIRSLPHVVDIMNQTSMGKTAPKIPILLYHSKFDAVAPIKTIDKLYDFYCSRGALVQYKRDFLSTHISAAVTGTPKALLFLNDMMNGRKLNGCSKKTVVSELLDGRVLVSLPRLLFNALLNLVGTITRR